MFGDIGGTRQELSRAPTPPRAKLRPEHVARRPRVVLSNQAHPAEAELFDLHAGRAARIHEGEVGDD